MQFPWLLFLLLSEQDAWLDLEGNEFRVPRPHAFTRRATGGATGLTQLHCASLTRAAPGRGSTRRITVPVTGNSPKPEGKPLLRRNALKHETDSGAFQGYFSCTTSGRPPCKRALRPPDRWKFPSPSSKAPFATSSWTSAPNSSQPR